MSDLETSAATFLVAGLFPVPAPWGDTEHQEGRGDVGCATSGSRFGIAAGLCPTQQSPSGFCFS